MVGSIRTELFYSQVVKNTGFLKGLYKPEELDAAFIKESKENKLLFLNKLITSVGKTVKLYVYLML